MTLKKLHFCDRRIDGTEKSVQGCVNRMILYMILYHTSRTLKIPITHCGEIRIRLVWRFFNHAFIGGQVFAVHNVHCLLQFDEPKPALLVL